MPGPQGACWRINLTLIPTRQACGLQLEAIAMLGHVMGRTLVLPDHTSMRMVNMEGNVSLGDFYDVARLAAWVPVISMQEYMDIR